jgi:hypothetical protein
MTTTSFTTDTAAAGGDQGEQDDQTSDTVTPTDQ